MVVEKTVRKSFDSLHTKYMVFSTYYQLFPYVLCMRTLHTCMLNIHCVRTRILKGVLLRLNKFSGLTIYYSMIILLNTIYTLDLWSLLQVRLQLR